MKCSSTHNKHTHHMEALKMNIHWFFANKWHNSLSVMFVCVCDYLFILAMMLKPPA